IERQNSRRQLRLIQNLRKGRLIVALHVAYPILSYELNGRVEMGSKSIPLFKYRLCLGSEEHHPRVVFDQVARQAAVAPRPRTLAYRTGQAEPLRLSEAKIQIAEHDSVGVEIKRGFKRA